MLSEFSGFRLERCKIGLQALDVATGLRAVPALLLGCFRHPTWDQPWTCRPLGHQLKLSELVKGFCPVNRSFVPLGLNLFHWDETCGHGVSCSSPLGMSSETLTRLVLRRIVWKLLLSLRRRG